MKKQIMLLIGLIIIYVLLSFGLSYYNNSKKKVYLGHYTQVDIVNGKIKVKNKNEKIFNKKVKVFLKNDFYDAFMYSLEPNIYIPYKFFDKNHNSISFNDDFIAATRNTNIKIKDASERNVDKTSKENINNSDLNVKNIDFLRSKMYTFDINNDGKIERIYLLTSIKSEKVHKTYFVLNTNDDFKVFYSYEQDITIPFTKNVYMYKFIDFNNDGIYEVVLGRNIGGDIPPSFDIYSFKNNSLKK